MFIDKSKRRMGGSYIKENGRLKKAPPASKNEKGAAAEPAAAKSVPTKKETKS